MGKGKKEYTAIIFDWNGTLLDDVDPSIATMNELLAKRNIPPLTRAKYKRIFGFPVLDYYLDLGFDFKNESWEDVAAEFMTSYHDKEDTFSLYDNVRDILHYLKKEGYRLYILSAMKTPSIIKMLRDFKIEVFFDAVYGLDHHYADGKIDLGREFMVTEQLIPQECLLIGDTIHDAEVAQALHIDSYLVSYGHQSHERLKKTGKTVLKDLTELRNKFQQN